MRGQFFSFLSLFASILPSDGVLHMHTQVWPFFPQMSANPRVWFLHHVLLVSFSHSSRTHGRSNTAKKLNGVKDSGITLCRENLPPIRSARHGFGSRKDHQGWTSPNHTGSYCRVWAPAYTSKTADEIKYLTLTFRVWSPLKHKEP